MHVLRRPLLLASAALVAGAALLVGVGLGAADHAGTACSGTGTSTATGTASGSPAAFSLARARTGDSDGDGRIDNVTLHVTAGANWTTMEEGGWHVLLAWPGDEAGDEGWAPEVLAAEPLGDDVLLVEVEEGPYPLTGLEARVAYDGEGFTSLAGTPWTHPCEAVWEDGAAPVPVYAQAIRADDVWWDDEGEEHDMVFVWMAGEEPPFASVVPAGGAASAANVSVHDGDGAMEVLDWESIDGVIVAVLAAGAIDEAGLDAGQITFRTLDGLTDAAGNPVAPTEITVDRLAMLLPSLGGVPFHPFRDTVELPRQGAASTMPLDLAWSLAPSSPGTIEVDTWGPGIAASPASVPGPLPPGQRQAIELTSPAGAPAESTNRLLLTPAWQSIGTPGFPFEYLALFGDDALAIDVNVTGAPTVLETNRSSIAFGEEDAAVLGVRLTEAPPAVAEVRFGDPSGRLVTAPDLLTFGPDDWDAWHESTITAVDDDVPGNTAALPATVTVRTGGSALRTTIRPHILPVTVYDDDAVFVVTETGSGTVVGESTSDKVEVVLVRPPDGTVAVDAVAGPDVAASPARLIFGPGNWSTPRTVTVSSPDDPDPEEAHTGLVALRTNASASSATLAVDQEHSIQVTVQASDPPGLELAPASLVVDEGAVGHLAVRLAARPADGTAVTLRATSLDETVAAVSPGTLTFGRADWDQAQTLNVSGVPDGRLAGNRSVLVRFQADAAATTDDRFDAVTAHHNVAVKDAEAPRLDLTAPTEAVAEGAASNMTVALAVAPRGGDTVTVRLSGPGLTFAPSTIAFAPDDGDAAWNVTVAVTPLADDAATGPRTATATATVTSGDAGGYGATAAATATVRIEDRDAGLLLSTPGLTVREGGGPVAYTLALAARPATPVTVRVAGGERHVTVEPAQLEFPAGDREPRTVRITAVDDGTTEPPATVRVYHDAIGDAAYEGMQAVLALTVQDDDEPEPPRVLTPEDIRQANLAMTVTAERRPDGTVVRWNLPPALPAPPEGVQVWRDGVLLATIPVDDPAFAKAAFVDPAGVEGTFRVTVYFGPAEKDGHMPSAAAATDLPGFQEHRGAAPRVSDPGGVGVSTGALLGFAAAVAAVGGAYAAGRRRR